MTDITELITLITSISAFVGAILAVTIAWRKAPAEKRKLGADASEVYERIAQRTGEQIEGLRARIDTLEEQNELYDRALEEVESEIAMYQRTLAEWREGIEKLLCQMKENNIEPIWMPAPESKEIPSRPRKRPQ